MEQVIVLESRIEVSKLHPCLILCSCFTCSNLFLLKIVDLFNMLWRKKQDIVNVIYLVHTTKLKLENLSFDQRWTLLFRIVTCFFQANNINIPHLDSIYIASSYPKRVLVLHWGLYSRLVVPNVMFNVWRMTLEHHFKVEILLCVIKTKIK